MSKRLVKVLTLKEMSLNKDYKRGALLVNFENFAEMQKIGKKGGYIHQQILDKNKKVVHWI